ncbi:MAG: acetate--CoA ligase family protein [Sinobacteraceae bacterium]|nr:acetate--CoA ligase family protein [Nevskiaceae bacterium]
MSRSAIERLLAPRTLALFGSDWADAVAAAARTIGFRGEIWRIHPSRASSSQQHYFRSVGELPGAPDASFVAAPAAQVPRIAAELRQCGAGGFVCFAAGFSELATPTGRQLTRQLVAQAGGLPFFGPNCYGFINFFDRAALWPDQLVGGQLERGVAIICQSGTLALNLLFNQRSVPLGYVLTVGNQTCLAVEDMLDLLADDARVSAFGLYVEGVKDIQAFAAAVAKARHAGKAIALVKAGRTETAARTARTHTGSLAGADRVFDSFCRQAGIARCESLATLCETLKVLHTGGPLRGRRLLVMGASGGDMAMTADAARALELDFPPFAPEPAAELRALLGERVTVANPFDFHTHIWFDTPAMRAMFSAVNRAGFDATGFMVDCPPEGDPRAYIDAIDQYLAAHPGPPTRSALICSLPESMAPSTRQKCLDAGVVPLQGQREALEALHLAAGIGEAWDTQPPLQLRIPRLLGQAQGIRSLSEHEGKTALAGAGITIPRSVLAAPHEAVAAAQRLGFPVVMKASGARLEHKTEVGGVIVNIRSASEAAAATQRLSVLSQQLLIEEMVSDGVAELLVGITVDAQFGQVLLLGAGGVLAELLQDTLTVLPPYSAETIQAALRRLKIDRLLRGYRGKPAGDVDALIAAVLACTAYAEQNMDRLTELDINPIIVRPAGYGAVAVDALIRLREDH